MLGKTAKKFKNGKLTIKKIKIIVSPNNFYLSATCGRPKPEIQKEVKFSRKK